MEKQLRILMLEDSIDDISLIQRELKRAGMLANFSVADTRPDFEKALVEFIPDLILCDHSMPMFNSLEALGILRYHEDKLNKKIPIILVTGTISEEFASQCIQAGADDYVLKDRMRRLPDAIRNTLEKCNIENERKSFLGRIVASEARMKEAEQLVHFGIWKTEVSTGQSTWSDEVFRIFGYEPGEIEPGYETFLSHLDPGDLDRITTEIKDAIDKQISKESEFRIITRAGDAKFLFGRVAVQHSEQGVVHLTGLCLDITQRKLAEHLLDIHERKQAQVNLETQNKVLKEMARIQSHEVRGLLARIIGLLDLIGHHKNDLPTQTEAFERLNEAVLELDTVIQKVVRMSEEAESGKIK